MKKLFNKQNIISIIIIAVAILSICLINIINQPEMPQLEEAELKNVFELSTVKAYYHNVAKGTKAKGSGFTHIGEKDRTFWLEYTGYVNIGIDMNDVTIEIKKDKVTITMPHAKVLDYGVHRDKDEKIEIITSDDGWNENKVTQKDQDKAISNAQNEMVKKVENNTSLMQMAEKKAKESIEEHILHIGDLSNIDYKITWKTIEE